MVFSKPFNKTERVLLVQRWLLGNGYDVGIDGFYGDETARAVADFKTDNHLEPDDKINEFMLENLFTGLLQRFNDGYSGNWLDADEVNIQDDLISSLFPSVDKKFIQAVFAEINARKVLYQLNTPLRQAHSLAQVRSEVGSSFLISENLNYSADALKKLFKFYRNNPRLAERHGRTHKHKASQEQIANHAYAHRIGNGSPESGDGWKFRGRGIKALTGRTNYHAFTQWHLKIFPAETVDFVSEPDLLKHPVYAARSGCFYWLRHKLYLIADRGSTASVVNDITRKINPHLPRDHKKKRVGHFTKIWEIMA